MGNKISMDELKAMISTEIRQKNLNNELTLKNENFVTI